MTQAVLLLVGQLVVEAVKRVDLTLLEAVVNAVRESDADDLDQLILLAKLQALEGIMEADKAQRVGDAIGS